VTDYLEYECTSASIRFGKKRNPLIARGAFNLLRASNLNIKKSYDLRQSKPWLIESTLGSCNAYNGIRTHAVRPEAGMKIIYSPEILEM
jgi:hypothetical protein